MARNPGTLLIEPFGIETLFSCLPLTSVDGLLIEPFGIETIGTVEKVVAQSCF